MLPSPSSASVALVRAFSRDLALAGGLLSPDYLESGLTLGEARCLWELGSEAGLTLTALAERLGLDLGYVSRAVSRLVSRRLLSKRSDGEDRRSRRIVLTRTGRARLVALGKRADRRLGAWLDGKPAGGVERLLVGMRAFLDDGATEPTTIRDARPGDVGRIITRHAEIYEQEFGYPAVFEGYVVAAFAKFLADFSPPRDRILVAERDGFFVGSIAVKGLSGARAQLRFLIVERAARGTGLGKLLVQAIVDHARDHGERQIVLETASDLDAARGLYAAHGFRKVGAVDVEFLPRGVKSETWWLDLPAS